MDQEPKPPIKSFADFLKSPNRIGITVLGLLFAIIAGLIIAIIIIPKDAVPSKRPTELGKDIILETASTIDDISRRLAYFEKLNNLAETDEDKNLVTSTCLESIVYSSSENRALECIDKFEFNKSIASKEDLFNYYLFLRYLYLQVDNAKYEEIYQESAELFEEILNPKLPE